jgi:hypothetical protein
MRYGADGVAHTATTATPAAKGNPWQLTTRKVENLYKRIKLAVATILVTLGLGGAVLALTGGQASASYYFPGLSVIDTQASGGNISCDQYVTQGGNPECYTWIRVNGQLRRGSGLDYYVEASHGYVLVACSAGYRGPLIGSWGPPWGDFWGSPQSPYRYQWVGISSHPYCQSPVLGPGYNYSGYSWDEVANGNPQ